MHATFFFTINLVFVLSRDAEDAVHARDGYDYDGYRLRVEFPRGSQNSGGGGGNHRYREYNTFTIQPTESLFIKREWES